MKCPLILTGIVLLVSSALAYDLIYNTSNDVTQWKFNGSYIYSRTAQDVAEMLPGALSNAINREEIPRVGLWLTKYTAGPYRENFLSLKHSMKHHLLSQVLIQFIATPRVPITVTTNNGEVVGKFWSDGEKWCDAFFNIDGKTMLNIDVETPEAGDVLLIDKIVFGVMANITQTNQREIIPCLTSPPTSDMEVGTEIPPDMVVKPPRRSAFRTEDATVLPDMTEKPSMSEHSGGQHHSHGHGRGASGRQEGTGHDPRLDTNTITSSGDSESTSNDASEVKCGCSCSCSRVKAKKNSNTTISPTG